MVREVGFPFAAEADVDEVPLAKDPPVALQVGAEEQLGPIGLNRTMSLLSAVVVVDTSLRPRERVPWLRP